jgi:hypothetical protein
VSEKGNQNIKPCPFPGCGAECEVTRWGHDWRIRCQRPGCDYCGGITTYAEAIAAHNRVAACVEACQGIPTEALGAGVLTDAFAALKSVCRQTDIDIVWAIARKAVEAAHE